MSNTQAILQTIKAYCAESKYYEAQQLYKHMNNKFINTEKYDKSIGILMSGIKTMIEHNQVALAYELAECVIRTFEKAGKECNLAEPKWSVSKTASFTAIELVHKIADSFPEGSKEKIHFLKDAITWSSTKIEQPKKSSFTQGEPSVHLSLGKVYWKSGNYTDAHKHYALANQPLEHSELLLDWSLKGNEGEYDLFIARAVLQMLCMNKQTEAKQLFIHYMNHHLRRRQNLLNNKEATVGTPLTHFLQFLFIAIEKKQYQMFQYLKQTYAPALKRDTSFDKYLKTLPEVHFGVRQQEGGFGGMLNQLMSSFFGGAQ